MSLSTERPLRFKGYLRDQTEIEKASKYILPISNHVKELSNKYVFISCLAFSTSPSPNSQTAFLLKSLAGGVLALRATTIC